MRPGSVPVDGVAGRGGVVSRPAGRRVRDAPGPVRLGAGRGPGGATALLSVLLLGLGATAPAPRAAPAGSREAPAQEGLRYDAPWETVARDLEAWIPERMRRTGVPGLAIALLRDGRTVWSRGFGVANSVTRRRVTERTVFPVAELGMPVAAYATLRLVDRGALELDAPLDDQLERPFLSNPRFRPQVSLRQVLSHTAGLSNQVEADDRRVLEPPGTRFALAAMGYTWLTRALAEAPPDPSYGPTLDALVHAPLGMESTVWTRATAPRDRTALAHLPAWVPGGVFGALAATTLAGVLLPTWVVLRWVLGRPLSRLGVLFAVLVALAVSTFVLAKGLGRDPALTCAAVFTAPAAAIAALVFLVRRRLALVIGVLVLSASLLVPALQLPVPVPPLEIPQRRAPNAAFSFRTTAHDMARFLEEVLRPEHLSEESAAAFRSPAAEVRPGLSWSLGLGIAHTEQGDALWHWGSELGYGALMLGYPDAGLGVVVLVNGAAGLELVEDVAQRALGGPRPDFRRGVRLAP